MTRQVVVMLASLAVTTALIAALERLLGFPPLILFVIPIAAWLQASGLGRALIVAAAASVIGDFFFVHPVREVTVHDQGLRLLVLLLVGTCAVSFAARRRASPPRH